MAQCTICTTGTAFIRFHSPFPLVTIHWDYSSHHTPSSSYHTFHHLSGISPRLSHPTLAFPLNSNVSKGRIWRGETPRVILPPIQPIAQTTMRVPVFEFLDTFLEVKNIGSGRVLRHQSPMFHAEVVPSSGRAQSHTKIPNDARTSVYFPCHGKWLVAPADKVLSLVADKEGGKEAALGKWAPITIARVVLHFLRDARLGLCDRMELSRLGRVSFRIIPQTLREGEGIPSSGSPLAGFFGPHPGPTHTSSQKLFKNFEFKTTEADSETCTCFFGWLLMGPDGWEPCLILSFVQTVSNWTAGAIWPASFLLVCLRTWHQGAVVELRQPVIGRLPFGERGIGHAFGWTGRQSSNLTKPLCMPAISCESEAYRWIGCEAYYECNTGNDSERPSWKGFWRTGLRPLRLTYLGTNAASVGTREEVNERIRVKQKHNPITEAEKEGLQQVNNEIQQQREKKWSSGGGPE
ncbi:hypothetical protein FA15DRAFT_692403 [Coprinopsis marcescibilis]|uniref:Uncharacterized protein n=1 Tax=Coprinopsis marcescibilis TaxID=230819 RepID=A0A5C3L615_COPMA|nr:hypothetical protein FA15DRAFT_692403 [Coprinopsis marcescibilis]